MRKTKNNSQKIKQKFDWFSIFKRKAKEEQVAE